MNQWKYIIKATTLSSLCALFIVTLLFIHAAPSSASTGSGTVPSLSPQIRDQYYFRENTLTTVSSNNEGNLQCPNLATPNTPKTVVFGVEESTNNAYVNYRACLNLGLGSENLAWGLEFLRVHYPWCALNTDYQNYQNLDTMTLHCVTVNLKWQNLGANP